MSKKAYLILQNGDVFEGESFGAEGTVISEIVFTTGMTGYLETLTDKSYFGQAVVQSFPLIGNYGVIPADFEGKNISPSAYIVKHWCREPSNFRSEGDLDTFFKARNLVGLCEIDTRSLVRTIRESGTMNGMVTTDLSKVDPAAIAAYTVHDAVKSVTTRVKYVVPCKDAKYRVAVIDLGVKENILRSLTAIGCEVHVFPVYSTPEEILAVAPDGIMLTNGPGDPVENTGVIQTLRALKTKKIPTFGICLGHQLLVLANGFTTCKLKYGHRGANQPVRELATGRVYITSQNHGYAVVSDSVDPAVGRVSFENNNDGSCEGIDYLDAPAFTVQFHPEACAGPQDTNALFGRFISMMEDVKNA